MSWKLRQGNIFKGISDMVSKSSVTIPKGRITMPKTWSLGVLKVHAFSKCPRHGPFFALLFIVFLALSLYLIGSYSSLYSPKLPRGYQDKNVLEKYGFLYNKSKFGKALLPTTWHQMHSPLGPDMYDVERAYEILNCLNPKRLPKLKSESMKALELMNNGNESLFKEECPSYFQWIHKDLAPWKDKGIKKSHIEMAKKHATFEVVILKGELYMDLYGECFQTRILFMVWGMLLLLEKYKHQVPDVEIMFNCMDLPRIKKTKLRKKNPSSFVSPSPLFSFCSNGDHYDIPWPDWSFWGWSELQMESWDQELDKILKGSTQHQDWNLKVPLAYWRGNPNVGNRVRRELLLCDNATSPSKANIFTQDWKADLGKKNSKLENQCNHRYMIYVEGVGWSVSLKYIMACGSPTLAISPHFYDFYMRGLEPWIHYIPVRPSTTCAAQLCPSIDNKVNFGEMNPVKATQIGKAGQAFVKNELGMKNVYDYMFNMLSEYAKLQRFHPSIPKSAHLVTQDYLLCIAQPLQKLLVQQAKKHVPFSVAPCQISLEKDFKDLHWEANEHYMHKQMPALNCFAQ